MPGKSRHRRGKPSLQSKKKERASQPAILAQQPTAVQAQGSVSHPEIPTPQAGVPTTGTKPAAVRFPYITTELRTIGILAGIMLIILVVLALVLS